MKEDYEGLLRAGVQAARDERWDEAEDLVERALEKKPGDIPAMNMLGFVFWRRGDPEEAERYYRASLDIDGRDAHARKGLGLCLVDRGRLEEGEAEIKRAIDLRRNWAEPYYDLGVILAREERFDEAWRLLEVASRLDSELATRLEDLLPQIKASARATQPPSRDR